MIGLYETLEYDFLFQDYRGQLIQLIHEGFKQVNIIKTEKGVTRGNHYHKRSREAFYVITGSVDVIFSKEDKIEKVHFKQGDFFLIPPFIAHSMYYPEYCILIALYDEPIELPNGEKDIYPIQKG